MSGFDPDAGASVQVAGSRTFGVFVLPTGAGTLSTAVLESSLRDSVARESTDFVRVMAFGIATDAATPEQEIVLAPEDEWMFEESELAGPRVLDPSGHTGTSWLTVTVEIETYAPGTRAYLVVTSEALVFAMSVVRPDGTAHLDGSLPISALEGGMHRLRVVGIRDLGPVAVDENGAILLSPELVSEIRKFDRGTTAIVRIVGEGASGGTREAVRYVPLRAPWPGWVLLVLGGLDLVLFGLVRRRALISKRRKSYAFAVLSPVAVAAAWIGWVAGYEDVILASAILGLAGWLIVQSAPYRSKGAGARLGSMLTFKERRQRQTAA